MPRGKAQKTVRLINAAIRILERIHPATVRSICYQLFVAGVTPGMAKNVTNGVGEQLVWAREKGYLPWHWIVDETREMEGDPTWEAPEEFAASVTRGYRRDYWSQQYQRVLVVSEKSTVSGTLRPLLDAYGVKFLPVHGFSSTTKVHELAELSQTYKAPLRIFYVGDWDPSGLYMSNVDLPNRLAKYGATVELQRLALNGDDVGEGNLPSFPATDKIKDSRYRWFVERYGDHCWELDALSPVLLRERVEYAIRSMIDADAWDRCLKAEAVEQQSLLDVMNTWKALAS